MSGAIIESQGLWVHGAPAAAEALCKATQVEGREGMGC